MNERERDKKNMNKKCKLSTRFQVELNLFPRFLFYRYLSGRCILKITGKF